MLQDMQQAGRKYGTSTVQLQIKFKRHLHPVFPPSVRVVAPRFQGPILAAIASHPILSSEGWDPMLSAREFLLVIKTFLEVVFLP
jgi:hypothetical protein